MPSEDALLRMRAQNNQFNAEMATSTGVMRGFRQESDRVGGSLQQAHRRSFLMNQVLFTLRRVTYSATLAIGALGTAAGFMGLKFNASMEQNRIAFKYLLGNSTAANAEIQTLYDLAAKTPFEFGDLTMAARKFLGVGLSVQQTNRYLTAAADAVAAMGGGSDVIAGVVRAFSQITTRGKVMGEELNQLAERGIPAYRILREELGLTGEQIARVGELGIPANVAIEALTRGMEKRFSGASAELAKTVSGQLTTLRDYSRQLFGEIMMAPFLAIQDRLPGIILTVQEMGKVMREQGFMAMFQVLDSAIGANGRLVATMQYAITTGTSLGILTKETLIPALILMAQIVATTAPLFVALGLATNFAADNAAWLAPWIKLLIFYWTLSKFWLVANWIWKTKLVQATITLAFWEKFLAVETWLLARLTNILTAAEGILLALRGKQIQAATGQFIAYVGLEKIAWRLRLATLALTQATWANTVAMLANPWTWVALGIAALIVLLIIAEIKWQAVSRAIRSVRDELQGLGDWLHKNFGWLKDFMDWTSGLPGGHGLINTEAARWIGIGGMGGVGMGGASQTPIPVMGGAPQLQTLQAGQAQGVGGLPPEFVQVLSSIQIDGREIAKAVSDHRLDRQARQ